MRKEAGWYHRSPSESISASAAQTCHSQAVTGDADGCCILAVFSDRGAH